MNNPTPNTPIRVLIAEDHPIMRQGLGVVLDAYDDLVLVGEAENGEQAVQLAQDLEPDVIVMDIQMPVKDGISRHPGDCWFEIGNSHPGSNQLPG